MKLSTVVTCMLAVVLWVGPGALAQGKGQGGGDKGRDKQKEVKAENTKGNPRAGETAPKNVGKGKADKPANEGVAPGATKKGGPQGKKAEKAVTDAAEKAKAKGKGHEQQAQALQKQLQQEQGKHMERLARLNRIRELAEKKGDKDAVARVDKLIAKEQEVYGRKLQQMQGQPRATAPQLPPPVTPPAGPDQPGKGKVRTPEPKTNAGDAGEVQKEPPAEPEKPKTE